LELEASVKKKKSTTMSVALMTSTSSFSPASSSQCFKPPTLTTVFSCRLLEKKMLSEILVHKIQGTLNNLSASMQNALATDSVIMLHQGAVHIIEMMNWFTISKKHIIINEITAGHTFALTFMALSSDFCIG
jgi:hypothetical protein